MVASKETRCENHLVRLDSLLFLHEVGHRRELVVGVEAADRNHIGDLHKLMVVVQEVEAVEEMRIDQTFWEMEYFVLDVYVDHLICDLRLVLGPPFCPLLGL